MAWLNKICSQAQNMDRTTGAGAYLGTRKSRLGICRWLFTGKRLTGLMFWSRWGLCSDPWPCCWWEPIESALFISVRGRNLDGVPRGETTCANCHIADLSPPFTNYQHLTTNNMAKLSCGQFNAYNSNKFFIYFFINFNKFLWIQLVHKEYQLYYPLKKIFKIKYLEIMILPLA